MMMKMTTTAALDAVHTGNALNGAIQTKIANRNTRVETLYQNTHNQKRIIQNFGRSQLQQTRPILGNFQRGRNLEFRMGKQSQLEKSYCTSSPCSPWN